MPLPVHRVLAFDPETMTGECAACGPVRIRYKARGQGVRRPACAPGLLVHKGQQRGDVRRPHGLTSEEARALRAGKPCAICGRRAEDGARLTVDHCHRTGRRRGVLCNDCNLGLGRFADDPERLAAAIAYLTP